MSYASMNNTSANERLSLLPDCLTALIDGECDIIANLANAAALIYDMLDDINWAGFYRVSGDTLVLAPFQGKPACVRLTYGRGVCGTAWSENRTLIVPDVHAFPGHIACDADSKSEIVVVIHAPDNSVWGVLDIDAPIPNRFSECDRLVLERVAVIIEKLLADSI